MCPYPPPSVDLIGATLMVGEGGAAYLRLAQNAAKSSGWIRSDFALEPRRITAKSPELTARRSILGQHPLRSAACWNVRRLSDPMGTR